MIKIIQLVVIFLTIMLFSCGKDENNTQTIEPSQFYNNDSEISFTLIRDNANLFFQIQNNSKDVFTLDEFWEEGYNFSITGLDKDKLEIYQTRIGVDIERAPAATLVKVKPKSIYRSKINETGLRRHLPSGVVFIGIHWYSNDMGTKLLKDGLFSPLFKLKNKPTLSSDFENKSDWVMSNDKKLSLRTGTDKKSYSLGEDVFFMYELQNNSKDTIRTLGQYWGYVGSSNNFHLSGPKGEIYYIGPHKEMSPPNKTNLLEIQPGKTGIIIEKLQFHKITEIGKYHIKYKYFDHEKISDWNGEIKAKDLGFQVKESVKVKTAVRVTYPPSASLGLGYGFQGKRVEIIVNGHSVYSTIGTKEIENHSQLLGTYLIKNIVVYPNSVTVEVIVDGQKSGKFNLDLTKGRIIEIYNHPRTGLSVTNTKYLALE